MCTPPHTVSHSLGVGLLKQRRPELVLGLGVHEDEVAPARRQQVVDDDVDPLAVAPEPEVEDPGVVVGFLIVPLLLLVVRDHLGRQDTRIRARPRRRGQGEFQRFFFLGGGLSGSGHPHQYPHQLEYSL